MTYTTRTWRGQPNYVCDLCPFATLDEAAMKARKRSCEHCQPRATGLLEPSGAPIVAEVTEPARGVPATLTEPVIPAPWDASTPESTDPADPSTDPTTVED